MSTVDMLLFAIAVSTFTLTKGDLDCPGLDYCIDLMNFGIQNINTDDDNCRVTYSLIDCVKSACSIKTLNQDTYDYVKQQINDNGVTCYIGESLYSSRSVTLSTHQDGRLAAMVVLISTLCTLHGLH